MTAGVTEMARARIVWEILSLGLCSWREYHADGRVGDIREQVLQEDKVTGARLLIPPWILLYITATKTPQSHRGGHRLVLVGEC